MEAPIVDSRSSCSTASAAASAAAVTNFEEAFSRYRNGCGVRQARVSMKQEHVLQFLEYCHTALQLIKAEADADGSGATETDSEDSPCEPSLSADSQPETAHLCDRLKSQVDSPEFLEKLGSIHASISKVVTERSDEASTWDIITESDLLDLTLSDTNCLDQEYIFVHDEDIVDGIACFMATYLATLKQTKDLTPQQLQKALSKTFAQKKSKGKIRRVWDSSKAIYNVVSWGATAVGIYQNPLLTKAASTAFWSCFQAVSKIM